MSAVSLTYILIQISPMKAARPNSTARDISGCTVLSIMRYEENGEIDSEYSKSRMNINGNDTYPRENTKSFSSNVLELLKGSIIKGYSEQETIELLKDYGVKLSNYERQINLGDLDAQYMLLIETPQDKVNFLLNNMENIVLTIPTSKAPTWMVEELRSQPMHIKKIIILNITNLMIMNRQTISTIIVIICMLIIGLYAMGEVNYFSSKIAVERNIESPAIVIPSIGVNEKINNQSLSQGVSHEPSSYMPEHR